MTPRYTPHFTLARAHRQPVAVALAFQQLDIGLRAMLANSAISGVGVPRLQFSGHETRCRMGIM